MGRNYSFNLYYRVEDLEKALLETVKIADPEQLLIDVTLPDGKVIQLPFKADFKTNPVTIRPSGYNAINPSFDTIILFPNNPDVAQYLKNQSEGAKRPYDPDDFGVGYIYLIVYCGQIYVELMYMACCNDMSDLFLQSKGVQERFIELARSSGALGGVFNVEEEADRSLFDPQYKIQIPLNPSDSKEDSESEWDDEIDIDIHIPEVLQKLHDTKQNL